MPHSFSARVPTRRLELQFVADSGGFVIFTIQQSSDPQHCHTSEKEIFDGKKLRKAIDCNYFQMVPCTVGDLNDKFDLWMNEEGQSENDINEQATKLFGNQVFGGKLYGNVLIIKCGTVD